MSAFLIMVSGCGPTKNNNIYDACIEMAQTSVGFTGPSKRMDIMKSYEIPLGVASNYNQFVSMHSSAVNAAERNNVSGIFDDDIVCLNQLFSCERMLDAITNENIEYMEEYIAGVQQCR